MSCGCAYTTSGDFDRPSCWMDTIRRARKAHRCCECGCNIEPGERYEYASGVWDGRPGSFKTCIGCLDVRHAFSADDSWEYGGLWQNMRDSDVFETLTTACECFRACAPEGKAKVLREWRRWKGLDRLDDEAQRRGT